VAERDHPRAAIDAARRDPVIPQEGDRLAAATAEVEDELLARKEREVARDPLADLILGAAVAALELEVDVLLARLGDRGRCGPRCFYSAALRALQGSRFGRFGQGEGGAQAPQEVARLAPVAIELLVGAGE